MTTLIETNKCGANSSNIGSIDILDFQIAGTNPKCTIFSQGYYFMFI